MVDQAPGIQGSPVVRGQGQLNVDLAKYLKLDSWNPKVGDFLIYHGWFWSRWYGIVNGVNDVEVSVIIESLPVLLFTMPSEAMAAKSKKIPIGDIKGASTGEYHVLQGEVWYI